MKDIEEMNIIEEKKDDEILF